MPLRDHFRPPVSKRSSWEGFHAFWPAMIVQRISTLLPPNYVAEPRAHLGQLYEVDVASFEEAEPRSANDEGEGEGGGVATATQAPPRPTLTLATSLSDQAEYAVQVYDQEMDRRLVATLEIVSPANKDRPEHRRAFVAKLAATLQKGVCVSVIDLVTVKHFNLYADLLDLIDRSDPSLGSEPPTIYATTCRGRKAKRRAMLDIWNYPLEVGQPLPSLPMFLSEDISILVDLESSYEDACRVLRVP